MKQENPDSELQKKQLSSGMDEDAENYPKILLKENIRNHSHLQFLPN